MSQCPREVSESCKYNTALAVQTWRPGCHFRPPSRVCSALASRLWGAGGVAWSAGERVIRGDGEEGGPLLDGSTRAPPPRATQGQKDTRARAHPGHTFLPPDKEHFIGHIKRRMGTRFRGYLLGVGGGRRGGLYGCRAPPFLSPWGII